MKYIELFAGCGGLSLGLESSDYEMVFANELSPMAGETFAYNLLGEDLRQLADTAVQPPRLNGFLAIIVLLIYQQDLEKTLNHSQNSQKQIQIWD